MDSQHVAFIPMGAGTIPDHVRDVVQHDAAGDGSESSYLTQHHYPIWEMGPYCHQAKPTLPFDNGLNRV